MTTGELPSSQSAVPLIFDRGVLAARRRRALRGRWPGPDFLLRRVADDFAERVAAVRRSFGLAIAIGFHNAIVADALRAAPNVGILFKADVSTAAVGTADLIADEDALPIGDETIDLALSGLSLHLVNDLPGALVQLRRALKPDGLLLAALLGGETLHELREAFLVAETELTGGISPRVAPFADVRSLGGLLQRAGFALPVVDSDTVTVTYEDPLALMRELRAMGASNPFASRARATLRRDVLFRAVEIYQHRFGLDSGRIPATFEIITMTAWAPDASQPRPLQPGSAQISLSEVLRPRRP